MEHASPDHDIADASRVTENNVEKVEANGNRLNTPP